MKLFCKQVGQWSIVGCAAAALMASPRAIVAATPDANLQTNITTTADAPPVQLVKAATGSLPANYKPSPSLDEVIKLAQAGVSDEVLLAFIQNSKKEFSPTPDDIIFLNDLGVSEGAIAALIRAKADAPTAPAPTVAPPTNSPATANSVPVYTAPTVPQINGVVAQPAPDAVAAPPATVVVVQPTPEQQVTVTQFYDALAPYGNWVYVAGSGYCWQPTVAVVDVTWRPYAHRGRWAYTDCGWYWQSDYSWGWAPFHYGRWWRHPHSGWLWTPDTVWGPSWVSWRQHDSYCGWAPLPPAAHFRPGVGFSYHGSSVGVGFDFGLSFDFFTFVPTRHFADRRPYAHALARPQVTQIYNNTTVVNNYTTINKTTVVNHGIDHRLIAKASPEPITRVKLREDSTHQFGNKIAPDRSARAASEPALYRTQLTTPPKEKVQHVMTELQQHASRGDAARPGKAAGTPPQSIVRDTNPKPLLSPRAETVIPQPRTAPPARSTSEVPAKAKMTDERVNQYINELKTRREARPEPRISAETITARPSPVALPPAQGGGAGVRQTQTQQGPQPRAIQPGPQPGGERASQYVNELKTRQQSRPQNPALTPAPTPNPVPSAPIIAPAPPQPRNVAIAPPATPPQARSIHATQPPPVPQPRGAEGVQRGIQRAEQPVIRQPVVNQPAVEAPRTGGGAGRQSAPVYVPPPNGGRAEAPVSNGKSSGQDPTGRQTGGGKSERNDRK